MYPLDIEQVHIELTDKCQASCPQCLRNHFGGAEREFIQNVEITLEQFKEWFPIEFLQNLKNFYACGSLGDPAIAKDCLEIFEYVRQHSPTCRLALHTNGSLKTTSWWKKLAETLGDNGTVVFAIDGFKGEHEIYRRGTSWDKIIENAKAFIAAGGHARADCLIFKHNEDRIQELKEYLLGIGFVEVNLKPTNRFYGDSGFPVQDRLGKHEYTIHPPTGSKWQQRMLNPNIVKLVDIDNFNYMLNNATIAPVCTTRKEIYVDARGYVFPCCWTGSVIATDIDPVDPNMRVLRDRLNQSTVDLIDDIGNPSLHGTDIITALKNSNWASRLEKHWQESKTFVCVKNCASNLKDITK
jgi:MoaA/NifB/PqqE/SkfB family radical SAM enzyme